MTHDQIAKGRIADRNDNWAVVIYTRNGIRGNSTHVCTTFMDILSFLAERDFETSFSFFDAVSAEGNCAIHVNLAPESSSHANGLLERLLARILSSPIRKEKRFEVVNSSQQFLDVKVAEGFLMSLPFPGHDVGVARAK